MGVTGKGPGAKNSAPQGRPRFRRKIVWGVLFLLCGASYGTKDPAIAFLTCLVGAALIGWGVYVCAAEKKKPIKTTQPSAFRPVERPASASKPDYRIPPKMGECLLLYQYANLKVSPSEQAISIARSMQAANEWLFDICENEGQIKLYFSGNYFGELLDKTDMVLDWLRRDDPVIVGLKNINDHDGISCIAFAAFYRDEQKRLAYRENEIVRLVKYAKKDAQESLSFSSKGEKLNLEEDFDAENSVVVSDGYGNEIGYLPQKQAKRFLAEGCAGAFLESADYDDEKDKYIPHIKIYW